MSDYEPNTTNTTNGRDNPGVFKIAGMLIAFVTLLAAATAAAVVILKKVKEAMAQINIDTDFEPLDEDDLTKDPPVDEGCSVGEDE